MGNDELARLKTLLDYWVKHNQEHSQELREWVELTNVILDTETHQEILQAAKEMDKACEYLSQALKRLEERGR